MYKEKIRVAQIIGVANDGGVEAFAMNYFSNINRDRVQFDFFVESASKIIDISKIEAMGGRVIFIPHYSHLFRYVRTLKKLLKAGNYDVVHSNMNTLSVFSLYAAKKAGVKVRIAHSHSTSNKKERLRNVLKNLLRRFSKKYATHYFACSETAGRWLFGDKTFDSGKVVVINNAIELDRFRYDEQTRESLRAQLGIGDEICLGHVGRFMPQKNHVFLIDVFCAFNKLVPQSKLLLVGDGPLRGETEEKVRSLGLEERVIFAGVHKHSERYYQAMDAFLLPSLYEGLGMVLIEAQVSGLPCFVSENVPTAAKVLKSTRFMNLGDGAAEWAKAVANPRGALDEGNRTNRQDAYRSFEGTVYDIKTEAQKLLNLYEEMVERK